VRIKMKDGRKVADFAVQVIRVNSSPMSVVDRVGWTVDQPLPVYPSDGRRQSGPTGPFRAQEQTSGYVTGKPIECFTRYESGMVSLIRRHQTRL
jgi:hypothetical protein